jgi:hypothetical protein
MLGRLAAYGGPPPRRISLSVLVGRNWHTASAKVLAICACCGPMTEPSWVRISAMTAVCVSGSRSTYSEHVIVSESDGGGTSDEVRGPDVDGRDVDGREVDGREVDGVELRVVLTPGSVVIATVPGVVRSQAAIPAASTSVAPAIRTRVLIWATIGARES